MTSTMTARLGELRAQHEEAQSRLARLRTKLGAAVADADEVQAAVLRAEIDTLQRTIDELAAALPIVEERAQEAQRQAEALQRATAARLHNERRAAKLAAAERVDRALSTLGEAWAEFEALPEVSNTAAVNRPFSLCAAVLHHAPTLGWKMDEATRACGSLRRRVPSNHFRAFAESEDNATPTMNETPQ